MILFELDWMNAVRVVTAAIALTGAFVLNRRAAISPVTIYWTVFALSLFCFMVVMIGGDALGGPARALFGFGAAATCGWSWLFIRALFQSNPTIERWPLFIVGLLIASAYIGDLAELFAISAIADGTQARHIIDNLTRMLSSLVLLLPFIEALPKDGQDLSVSEQRLRKFFFAGYGGLIAVTALWIRGASEGSLAAQYEPPVLAVAPLIALVLSTAALLHRLNNPLAPARKSRPRVKPDIAAPTELVILAERVSARLQQDEYFTTPNLKVATLAALLDEPDYKVTKAISAASEFSNFNRLVNHFRLERAKALLTAPGHHDQSILEIALDCGFASLGPFNRAFKEATGMTPRAFRTQTANMEQSAPATTIQRA